MPLEGPCCSKTGNSVHWLLTEPSTTITEQQSMPDMQYQTNSLHVKNLGPRAQCGQASAPLRQASSHNKKRCHLLQHIQYKSRSQLQRPLPSSR
jgi:hypothetical protein